MFVTCNSSLECQADAPCEKVHDYELPGMCKLCSPRRMLLALVVQPLQDIRSHFGSAPMREQAWQKLVAWMTSWRTSLGCEGSLEVPGLRVPASLPIRGCSHSLWQQQQQQQLQEVRAMVVV